MYYTYTIDKYNICVIINTYKYKNISINIYKQQKLMLIFIKIEDIFDFV